MSEFVNTVDLIGDEALTDSIIDRSVTEILDSYTTNLGTGALRGCAQLTKAVFWNVTFIGNSAFDGCTNLAELELPKTTTVPGCRDCKALKKLSLPSLTGTAAGFWGCTSLALLDLYAPADLGQFAFYLCNNLKTLILRSEDVICKMPYAGTVGSQTYVYVPSSVLAEYQAATNWSAVATQFRALEDYTVDGTITGELDETKI